MLCNVFDSADDDADKIFKMKLCEFDCEIADYNIYALD